MRFFAYHGVLSEERLVGTYYRVDVAVDCNFSAALVSDQLIHTINYADIYQLVKTEMEKPSRLMERVAGRILERLFQTFPAITAVSLSILKENPPIDHFDGAGCSVEMEITRSEYEQIFSN